MKRYMYRGTDDLLVQRGFKIKGGRYYPYARYAVRYAPDPLNDIYIPLTMTAHGKLNEIVFSDINNKDDITPHITDMIKSGLAHEFVEVE